VWVVQFFFSCVTSSAYILEKPKKKNLKNLLSFFLHIVDISVQHKFIRSIQPTHSVNTTNFVIDLSPDDRNGKRLERYYFTFVYKCIHKLTLFTFLP